MKSHNQNNKPKISCIVVCCDSEKKGRSVFHCLQSITNQSLDDFEIIIMENSHKDRLAKVKQIKKYLSTAIIKSGKKIDFTIISERDALKVNRARNLAVKRSVGELLVFVEDDTIILDKNAFRKIITFAKKYDFGYGAKRLWTKKDWFNKKSSVILDKIKTGDYGLLKENSAQGNPLKDNLINNDFIDLTRFTFIANFGFCKKNIFEKVGGFPFDDMDLADDCFMFRLYEKYKYKFLGGIAVVHVTHVRKRTNDLVNLKKYFNELMSRGYYWFHVGKTFQEKQLPKNEVIESLKPWHPDYRLLIAYEYYKKLMPLDIKNGSIYSLWKDCHQLSKLEYFYQIGLIFKANNIDDYIKSSQGDFDNLAPIIKSLLEYGFLTQINGRIKKNGLLFKSTVDDIQLVSSENCLIPNSDYNQFPCDCESRLRRFHLIMSRYKFSEYLNFGFVGDDDLISILFSNIDWFKPIVLEKDKRIIDIVNINCANACIINFDLANVKVFKPQIKVQSFITDPPYTLHGTLAFIYAGILMLDNTEDVKEFFVVLNQMMMGNNFFKLIEILLNAGVYLFETEINFSNYKLPKNFEEYDRASNFMTGLGAQKDMPIYSSSSNLYVFRTNKPNVSLLRSYLKTDQLYNHYL